MPLLRSARKESGSISRDPPRDLVISPSLAPPEVDISSEASGRSICSRNVLIGLDPQPDLTIFFSSSKLIWMDSQETRFVGQQSLCRPRSSWAERGLFSPGPKRCPDPIPTVFDELEGTNIGLGVAPLHDRWGRRHIVIVMDDDQEHRAEYCRPDLRGIAVDIDIRPMFARRIVGRPVEKPSISSRW